VSDGQRRLKWASRGVRHDELLNRIRHPMAGVK